MWLSYNWKGSFKILRLFYLTFFCITYVNAIDVDGVLDEKEWDSAQQISDFTTIVPYNFENPKYRTNVKIFTNQDGIYVGFINEQDNETIRSFNHIRDDWDDRGDKNSFTIDFDGNSKVAYGFTVSLGDSLADATYTNGNSESKDWDGDWIARTFKGNNFWSSEFFIPWTVVPMQKVDGPKRNVKFIAFRWLASDEFGFGSTKTNWERETFIYDLEDLVIDNYQSKKYSYFPYLTVAEDSVTNESIQKVGIDIFLNHGDGSQTNIAINPDFGQVETDQVVVNFSAIETFFSEKRAFFTENHSLFEVKGGRDDFYVINTRRIGGRPDYDCSRFEQSDICENNRKEYSDLDLALRHTIQKEKVDLGFLAASESDENFSKGRDYFAFRVRSNSPQNKVGFLATKTKSNFFNESSDVYSLDIENTALKNTQISGYLLNSRKENSTGHGLRFDIKYIPNDKYENTVGFHYFDKDLDLNDMGYLQRNDQIKFYNRFEFDRNSYPKESLLRSRDSHISIFQTMTTDGKKSPKGVWTKTELSFKSNFNIDLSMSAKTEGKDTNITRKYIGSPYIQIMDEVSFNAGFGSPKYKNFSFGAGFGFNKYSPYSSWDSDGRNNKSKRFNINYFPNDQLQFSFGVDDSKEEEWLKWIDTNRLGSFTKNRRNINFGMTYFQGTRHEFRLKNQSVIIKAEDPTPLISSLSGELSESDYLIDPFYVS